MNNAGQVTGYSQSNVAVPGIPTEILSYHAFLYSNGRMIDLGTLVGTCCSDGFSINNLGQVVGRALYVPSLITHAFLYSNGQMGDVNNLIDPALGITLSEARGINDRGQIVANGNNDHAYLLSPIPEPSTLALFGVALSGAYVWSRRSKRVSERQT